jgi:hypothetical protein
VQPNIIKALKIQIFSEYLVYLTPPTTSTIIFASLLHCLYESAHTLKSGSHGRRSFLRCTLYFISAAANYNIRLDLVVLLCQLKVCLLFMFSIQKIRLSSQKLRFLPRLAYQFDVLVLQIR